MLIPSQGSNAETLKQESMIVLAENPPLLTAVTLEIDEIIKECEAA
ncbi:13862_t:CDS:1, partial [Ambispora leptoticha]